jgi:hypothetical protein
MNTPADLEAIIAKWPKGLTEPRFRLGEQHALQELYNNSKSRGSVSMRSNELAARLCMSEAQLETLMRPITHRHVQYRNNMYSLRSDGLMIFESPYNTNSKLIICLHDLQALDKKIELPDAARAAGMGEFSITKYYLRQLEKQSLVNIWDEKYQDKIRNSFKLTGLGWHLAEYLIKVKNIKPKIYVNGYKRYEKVF